MRDKLALHWGRRVLSRFVGDDAASDVPVAVMIPLAPKDVRRAKISIPRILWQLAHPVERAAVVAPENRAIRELCRCLGLDFIDETEPLSALLGSRLEGLDGWYRQQFLKLAAPEAMGAERVLTFDGDVYPLRPTAFVDGQGRRILYRGDRNSMPFHRFTEALIGPCPHGRTSFVAHCMLFEAERLSALRRAITMHCGRDWIGAILDRIKDRANGVLSEFDLYGHFLQREKVGIRVRYYANIKVAEAQFLGEAKLPGWKRRFRFVSNHER